MGNQRYPATQNLNKYEVFYEDDHKNPQLFKITNLPEFISYGKTPFYLGLIDGFDEMWLQNNSDLLVEITDSEGHVIFSDIVGAQNYTISGYAALYIRIDVDPDNTYEPIEDGIGYITVVGELEGDGVPNEWKETYNCRLRYPIEIKKDFVNESQILFENYPTLDLVAYTYNDSILNADKRGSTPSVIRSFTTIITDNIHTVGGDLAYIDVSYKTDASDTLDYTILDTLKVDNDVEYLTRSSSFSYYPGTKIGKGENALWEDYWLHPTKANWKWGNSGFENLGSSSFAVGQHQMQNTGYESYAYNIFRKTNSEEKLTIKYNITGSLEVAVLYTLSSSADALDRMRSGAPSNYFKVIPGESEGVYTAYTASYFNFNPDTHNWAIINGVETTSQSFDLWPTGSTQIIRDDFIIPSGAFAAIYISSGSGDKLNNGGVDFQGFINNISITPQEITGSSPAIFYKNIELQGHAKRQENLDFRVRYLNHNYEPAIDIYQSGKEYYSTASLIYNPEGIWWERGFGEGIETQDGQDTPYAPGIRVTNVSTSSGHQAVVGIMSDAGFHSEDEIWGGLQNRDNIESASIVGAKFTAMRPTSSDFGGSHRVIGIQASAYQSQSYDNTILNDIWAARFEHGNVFIRDDLSLSGSLNIDGNIYANEFHTTYTSASIIYDSGSTKFGDTIDDIHTFTGSIELSGSTKFGNTSKSTHLFKGIITSSADLAIFGSHLAINKSPGGVADESFHLHLHGGLDHDNGIYFWTGSQNSFNNGGYVEANAGSYGGIIFQSDDNIMKIYNHKIASEFFTTRHPKIWISGSSGVEINNLTGSSNISASGNLYGYDIRANNNLSVFNDTSLGNSADDTHKFQGHVTASNDISASGNVYGDNLYSDLLRRSSDNSTKVKLKLETDKMDFHTDHSSIPSHRLQSSSSFIEGNITASGYISASQGISASKFYSPTSMNFDADSYGQVFKTDGKELMHISSYDGVVINSGQDASTDFSFKDSNTGADLVKWEPDSQKMSFGGATPQFFTDIVLGSPDCTLQKNQVGFMGAGDSLGGILVVSSSITASGHSTSLLAQGAITSSGVYTTGPISSSNTLYSNNLILSGGLGVFTSASLAAGGGGSTNAAGSDTQVQFNDGGTNFGGDAGFTYNKDTDSITAITNITASGNISASGDLYGNNLYIDENATINHTTTAAATENIFSVAYQDSDRFIVQANGGVGIGTSTATHPLTVEGSISSSGVVIRAIHTLPVNDATPDVSTGSYYLTANTSTTNITGLDGGVAGQEVTIVMGDANTNFYDGVNFNIFRSLDWTTPNTNDVAKFLCVDGTKWVMTARQDNS